MRQKYSIGILLLVLVCVICILSVNGLGTEKDNSDQYKLEEENAETLESEPSVTADGQALKEDCFYLLEVNGYVVVFFSDKKTVYEYTDIPYDELPTVIRNEIRNGKYMESMEELYGFLENYSS